MKSNYPPYMKLRCQWAQYLMAMKPADEVALLRAALKYTTQGILPELTGELFTRFDKHLRPVLDYDIREWRADQAQQRRDLIAYLKGLPDNVTARYLRDFDSQEMEDRDDFNAYMAEIAPDIEAIRAELSVSNTPTR